MGEYLLGQESGYPSGVFRTETSSRELSEHSHSSIDERVMDTVSRKENDRLAINSLVEAGLSSVIPIVRNKELLDDDEEHVTTSKEKKKMNEKKRVIKKGGSTSV